MVKCVIGLLVNVFYLDIYSEKKKKEGGGASYRDQNRIFENREFSEKK